MKIALATEGAFFEERSLGVELHWGRGGGERITADVANDAADSSPALKAALESGLVVEMDATPQALEDLSNARLAAIAADMGLEVPKKPTKAALVALIEDEQKRLAVEAAAAKAVAAFKGAEADESMPSARELLESFSDDELARAASEYEVDGSLERAELVTALLVKAGYEKATDEGGTNVPADDPEASPSGEAGAPPATE